MAQPAEHMAMRHIQGPESDWHHGLGPKVRRCSERVYSQRTGFNAESSAPTDPKLPHLQFFESILVNIRQITVLLPKLLKRTTCITYTQTPTLNCSSRKYQEINQ